MSARQGEISPITASRAVDLVKSIRVIVFSFLLKISSLNETRVFSRP
jgi:hypothetical protein